MRTAPKRIIRQGVKESRKHYKKIWNRKVRHAKLKYNHSSYKKLGSDDMYNYVP